MDFAVESANKFLGYSITKSLEGWGKNGIWKYLSTREEWVKETLIGFWNIVIGFDNSGPG
jgi:hypothetical protein